MRKKLKRLTSMALAFILSVSAFPATAFAALDSTSTLAEVTAKYIDAENGKEIIQPETYNAALDCGKVAAGDRKLHLRRLRGKRRVRLLT